MDGEGAGAIVVQQGVEGLELRKASAVGRWVRLGQRRGERGGRREGEVWTRLGSRRTCCRLSSCIFPTTILEGMFTTGVALAPAASSSAPRMRIILSRLSSSLLGSLQHAKDAAQHTAALPLPPPHPCPLLRRLNHPLPRPFPQEKRLVPAGNGREADRAHLGSLGFRVSV